MELWALMNFQDCTFDDDGVSFYLLYLVVEAAGLQASIKIRQKRFSHGEDEYLILINHPELTLAVFFRKNARVMGWR